MKKIKAPNIKTVDLIKSRQGDKVKVSNFTVTPKNPHPGNLLKIKFTVINVSGKKLKIVPWRIVNNKTILYSGYRFNLSANSEFDVTATWQAEKGQHFFYVDIDPQNVLREPRSKTYDNFPQGVDIMVI